MQENEVKNKTGFTLIELLIVVLIIGILSAIALPGYRKAVERSRVSDALTTMQAVAKSEHGWYLNNNDYTKDFANLDIEINGTINEGALETDFYTYELLDTGILAERNNGDYSLYKDYESSQVLCMPGNHFVCENLIPFTKEPCEKLDMAWANTNSTCYVNEEERCLGLYADELGENIWKGTYCGYNNTNGKTINEGMKCVNTGHYTCGSIVNSGGECNAGTNVWGGCNGSTINAGGVCLATGLRSCASVTISGGECKDGEGSNGQSCWYSSISAGGICSAGGAGCEHAKVYKGGDCSGSCWRAEVYAGGVCSGICLKSSVTAGGICSGTCDAAKVYAGGVCSGNCGFFQGEYTQIYAGGKCISNEKNSCKNAKYPTDSETGLNGCCEGDYCGNAPKCNCKNADGSYATSC